MCIRDRWSYNKMLIDWVRSGQTGKYLALGHNARTSLRSVRTPWLRAKYFPVRPSHSVNKYIVLTSQACLHANTLPAGSNVITVIALFTWAIRDVSVVVKVTHAGMLSRDFSAFFLPQNRHYAHISREGALGSFEAKLWPLDELLHKRNKKRLSLSLKSQSLNNLVCSFHYENSLSHCGRALRLSPARQATVLTLWWHFVLV